jgi:hypothetical protein
MSGKNGQNPIDAVRNQLQELGWTTLVLVIKAILIVLQD